jgi:hypothetical protein
VDEGLGAGFDKRVDFGRVKNRGERKGKGWVGTRTRGPCAGVGGGWGEEGGPDGREVAVEEYHMEDAYRGRG